MSEFNPYAAPKSGVAPEFLPLDPGADVWRSDKELVMTKDAQLPDRCVKCNEPADGYRLRRNLSWHSPGWFLLVLVSPLIYVIVALCIRKTAKIHVGLCERHRARRRWAIAIGWLLALVGFLMIIAGANVTPDPASPVDLTAVGIFGGLLCCIVGLIYGVVAAQVAPPKKIDDRFVWLSKVHPAYLAELPRFV